MLLVWLAISLLVVGGAMVFGALGARHPDAGGLYVYLREGWGDRLAAVYGWECLLVMDPGVFAALATGVQPYVVAIWPGLAGSERWVALAVIWGVVAISMTGVRLSARTMVALTAVKLLALAAVIVRSFADRGGQWAHFAAVRGQSTDAISLAPAMALAAIAVFFSFGGFWDTSRIADRVRNPERTLPRTMTLGVACVALVYVLTTMAFIYLLPVSEAQDAQAFAGLVGIRLFGAAGAPLFAAIVALSVVTSALGLAMFAPRLYSAMAVDGVLPGLAIDERPGRLVLASVASVLAWRVGFIGILTFFMAPTLVFVGLAALSVMRPASNAGATRSVDDPAVHPPSPAIAAALFASLLAMVVVLVAVNQPWQAGAGFAVTAAGALAAARLGQRRTAA